MYHLFSNLVQLLFVIQVILSSVITEGLVYSENIENCTPLHVAAQYGNLQ